MPRFQADDITRKTSPVTRADIEAALAVMPDATRYELAEALGCS